MKNGSTIVVLAVLALVGFGIFFLISNLGTGFERSIIGNAGIAKLLEEEEVELEISSPQIRREIEEFGGRILPMQAPDVEDGVVASLYWSVNEEHPRTLTKEQFEEKIETLPTAVILAKWDASVLEMRQFMDGKTYSTVTLTQFLQSIEVKPLRVRREEFRFIELDDELKLSVFAPQYFPKDSIPENCKSLWENEMGVFIVSCDIEDLPHETIIVSDPDLLNNHGLSIAENSKFAVSFLTDWLNNQTPQKLYVDVVSEIMLGTDEFKDERQDYTRSSDDWFRMLEYPVGIIMALTLLIFGLIFWRGAFRFGEALQDDARSDRDVSSAASIQASAELLRMTGNDRLIVSDYVRQHLKLVSQRLFGDNADQNPISLLFAYLSKNKGEDGQAFIDVSNQLMSSEIALSNADLNQNLARYKKLAKKVIDNHEFD